MSHTSAPSQEYLKNAVMTASPEQLHLMLYDGAIRFVRRGLEAMRAKDREAMFNALERAQLMVLELGNGIRREVNPELADQMGALYSFIYRRLVDANIHQDETAIDEALRMLRYQRETWLLLMDKLRQELNAQPPEPDPQAHSPSDDEPTSFVAEG